MGASAAEMAGATERPCDEATHIYPDSRTIIVPDSRGPGRVGMRNIGMADTSAIFGGETHYRMTQWRTGRCTGQAISTDMLGLPAIRQAHETMRHSLKRRTKLRTFE